MPASKGRATSAGSLRPNAAQLNPRQLTGHLSHARDLLELLALHREHRDQFNCFHVGAFWSKFKKLARGQLDGLSDRLAPVCEQTVLMLPELNARALANLAHAFAQTGLVGTGPWQNVWMGLPEAIRQLIRGFDPQHLSNTVWAFAKAGHASPELFEVISAEAVRRRLGNFDPQALSNTAWAFAKAGHASPELFNAISAEAVRRGLGGFNEQNLSNTAWAFATAGHASPELFKAISAEAVRRGLGGFNPQDLSNTAWAFAKAGHASPQLFKAIAAEVVRRGLGDFNPQQLSNTAWAFAEAGHAPQALFGAIAAEVVRRGLDGFNEQDLSTMAWAFAVVDPPSADELFGTMIFVTRCALLEASVSHEVLFQLHQWSLWREERGARWPGLPNSLREACRAAFVADGETISQLQRDVVRGLRSYGFQVKDEHRCKITGYTIDALVTLNNGERIAVEVDGPCHFVGRSHQPAGKTLLKHRQLRYFEWRLKSVPYWDWDTRGCKALHWLPMGHR